MNFKIRLKCYHRRPRNDFASLRDDIVKDNHNKAVDAGLDKSVPLDSASGKLRRLNEAMRNHNATCRKRKQTWDNNYVESECAEKLSASALLEMTIGNTLNQLYRKWNGKMQLETVKRHSFLAKIALKKKQKQR